MHTRARGLVRHRSRAHPAVVSTAATVASSCSVVWVAADAGSSSIDALHRPSAASAWPESPPAVEGPSASSVDLSTRAPLASRPVRVARLLWRSLRSLLRDVRELNRCSLTMPPLVPPSPLALLAGAAAPASSSRCVVGAERRRRLRPKSGSAAVPATSSALAASVSDSGTLELARELGTGLGAPEVALEPSPRHEGR